jgi:hypothetical protein
MSGWWPPGRWWASSRGRLGERFVVLAGLLIFVGAVYVAVVIVVGAFLNRSGVPSSLLSVVATAIVAVGFEPARRRLQTWATSFRVVRTRCPMTCSPISRWTVVRRRRTHRGGWRKFLRPG